MLLKHVGAVRIYHMQPVAKDTAVVQPILSTNLKAFVAAGNCPAIGMQQHTRHTLLEKTHTKKKQELYTQRKAALHFGLCLVFS